MTSFFLPLSVSFRFGWPQFRKTQDFFFREYFFSISVATSAQILHFQVKLKSGEFLQVFLFSAEKVLKLFFIFIYLNFWRENCFEQVRQISVEPFNFPQLFKEAFPTFYNFQIDLSVSSPNFMSIFIKI
jgi:hypothetical protein